MPFSAPWSCLGTSSRSPSSPPSPLTDRPGSQEGAAWISREAAPASPPRTRPHPAHGEAGEGSGCQDSEITPALSTRRWLRTCVSWEMLPGSRWCFQSRNGYPWLLDPRWGCEGQVFGMLLGRQVCGYYDP